MTDTAALLAERLHALPSVLATMLLKLKIPPLTRADEPIWVTGGGMSEGPGRFLVALLQQSGLWADFVPLSEFVAPTLRCSDGTLVLLSQGLAPNARFPLRHVRSFRKTLLLTSVKADADSPLGTASRELAVAMSQGVAVLTLPPQEESGLLLRVMGPTVQALAVAALAGTPWLALQEIPTLYEALLSAPPVGSLLRNGEREQLALIAGGRYGAACFGLRWKLLEGLLAGDPPIWDLLQVAHGPLQSLWSTPYTLVVLMRDEAPYEAQIVDSLRRVLRPELHRIVPLRAQKLPGFLAYFEHSAQLDALLLDAVRVTELDLIEWPSRGKDDALYQLCPVS